ncbi:MAG: hypothetical protein V1674_05880 [Candidatus Omnitrophota bacterium]
MISKTLKVNRVYSEAYVTYKLANAQRWEEGEHRSNLEYMIKIALRNRCKILIYNYFSSSANNFLREFATTSNIAFCDNEKIFKEYPEPYSLINEDGWHPNKKGYSIIAQNLYDSMVKYNLFMSDELAGQNIVR